MKALIIDDEERARNLLTTLISDYCPQITALEQAEDLPQGVKKINSFKPNVVFLDIEMPGFSGTQILDFFEPDQIDFKIVFTTAYSEHAVKAFEMNAVDYLLKPLRPKQVKEAVEKVSNLLNRSNIRQQLIELKKTLAGSEFNKIGLPVADGLLFLELDEIICIEADGMYCRVFSKSNGCQIVSKPLKYFVDLLHGRSSFYRPHRSHLINIKHIKQFMRSDGNYIIMDNAHPVSLSKDKKEEFLELVSSL
jgi:two-component system LytT family response regulator